MDAFLIDEGVDGAVLSLACLNEIGCPARICARWS